MFQRLRPLAGHYEILQRRTSVQAQNRYGFANKGVGLMQCKMVGGHSDAELV